MRSLHPCRAQGGEWRKVDAEILGEQGKEKESLLGIARTLKAPGLGKQLCHQHPARFTGLLRAWKTKTLHDWQKENCNIAGCDYPDYTSLSNFRLD